MSKTFCLFLLFWLVVISFYCSGSLLRYYSRSTDDDDEKQKDFFLTWNLVLFALFLWYRTDQRKLRFTTRLYCLFLLKSGNFQQNREKSENRDHRKLWFNTRLYCLVLLKSGKNRNFHIVITDNVSAPWWILHQICFSIQSYTVMKWSKTFGSNGSLLLVYFVLSHSPWRSAFDLRHARLMSNIWITQSPTIFSFIFLHID